MSRIKFVDLKKVSMFHNNIINKKKRNKKNKSENNVERGKGGQEKL